LNYIVVLEPELSSTKETQLVFISTVDGDTASVVYDEDPIGSSEFAVLPQTTSLRRILTQGADVFRNTSDKTEIREYLLSLLLNVSSATAGHSGPLAGVTPLLKWATAPQ